MAAGQPGATNPNAARAPVRPGPGPAAPAGPSLDLVKLFKRYWVWGVLALFVGLGLGILAFYPLKMWFPVYRGEVIFQVSALPSGPVDPQGSTIERGGQEELEIFMLTQVQTILSEDMLRRAANDPRIREQTQWARRFRGDGGVFNDVKAGEALADVIQARVIPDTVYMTLAANTSGKEDAATIANTMARVYLTDLQQRSRADRSTQTQVLQRRLTSMQDDRRRLEQRAVRLLGDNQVESIEYRQSLSQQQIASLTPEQVATRNELEVAKERLAQYEASLASSAGPQFPDFLRQQVSEHPEMQRHTQNIAALRTQRRALLMDFGPNHMEVKRVDAQIRAAEIERDASEQRLLRDQFAGLIDITRETVRSLEARLREVNNQLDLAVAKSNELNLVLEEYRNVKDEEARRATEIATLQQAMADLEATQNLPAADRVRVFRDATVPERPAFPKMIITAAAGAFFGVLLVGSVVLLREVMEQRVRQPSDVRMIPRMSLFGLIPDLSEDPSSPPRIETAVIDRPAGVIAEQVRQMRTGMAEAMQAHGIRTVAVASGLPGSGGTSVLVSLARSFAMLDERVLVVDANFRRPGLHKALGVGETPGLGDVLAGRSTLADAAQQVEGTLHVLASGSQETRVFERLNSDAMSRVLDEARDRYDVVLVDVPPMAVAGDALVVANRCDASLLVARAYSETRGLIGRVGGQLIDGKSRFLGVVVNGVRASAGGYFKKNFRLTHEYSNGHAGAAGQEKKPRAESGKKSERKAG